MTLNEFIDKYLGKKVDYDGYYGGQCVDLYRQYVEDVLGFPQSPGVGGASEIWGSASGKYYDFIVNGLYDVPERGDIVVWDRGVGGGFGHVAIYLFGDVNSFTSLDQNWPTLDKVTKTKHNYTNVIGWLHPKENMPDDDFGDMVYKSTQHDETCKYIWGDDVDPRQKSSKDIQQYIGGLKSQITTLQNKDAESKAIIATQKEQISTLEGRVEQRENENLELQTAYNRITKEINDLRVSAETQIRVLEESIDQHILEKKELLEGNAVLEAKLANCEAGNSTGCWETFISNIKKLFGS